MRFILAVLMLAGWGMGQDKPSKDLPKLSDIQISGTSVMTLSGPMGDPKTILNCDPVLTDKGEWTPHVTNCKLENGGTLDDIVNAMADMRETERKQNDAERKRLTDGWTRSAEQGKKGIDLALKSATLYRSAYQKCIKAVDDFKLTYDPKAHKFSKEAQ